MFVMISGCSGGGKSTLLAELARRGYATVAEPGRRIIAEARAGDGATLPWVDAAAFARRALEMSIADHEAASGLTFFDRGIVDAAVEIVLDLTAPGASFALTFDHPDVDLGVKVDGDGLAIVFDARTGSKPPRYIASGARPSSLRIFLDAGSIEVFADNGRWAGSKRIPGFAAARSATLTGAVAKASVWQLKL